MIVNDVRNGKSQLSGRAFSHVDLLEKQVRYGAQLKTLKVCTHLTDNNVCKHFWAIHLTWNRIWESSHRFKEGDWGQQVRVSMLQHRFTSWKATLIRPRVTTQVRTAWLRFKLLRANSFSLVYVFSGEYFEEKIAFLYNNTCSFYFLLVLLCIDLATKSKHNIGWRACLRMVKGKLYTTGYWTIVLRRKPIFQRIAFSNTYLVEQWNGIILLMW